MLRVITRLIIDGGINARAMRTLGLGLGAREFRRGPFKGSLHAHRSLPSVLGTRYYSSSSDDGQVPSVNSPTSKEAPASTSRTSQNTSNTPKEKTKKVKSGTKSKKNKGNERGKSDKTTKESKTEKKPKPGNKQIVAALIDAINEDDWPMIIHYSTLDPRNLEGWYPGESEWLAAHRMSEAFSVIPEDKWDDLSTNGVISVPKLARLLAKKHI